MKKGTSFFLSLCIALLSPLAGSITQAQSPALFSDVPLDHWAYAYITAIFDAQITAGCLQDPPRYCPDDYVTREQMAVFVTRALGEVPEDGYCGTTNPFTDVDYKRWNCKYIKKLEEMGITSGYGDGRYGPEDPVTRAQMAVFLARALNQVPADGFCGTTNPFTDVNYDLWSCKYIKILLSLGIAAGYGDGRFGPDDDVTRAQMAVFLTRSFIGFRVLNVPFEPNQGGTCASSSMTMILKFNGLDITFEDVYAIAGPPPIINYSGVDQWIREDFGLTLKLYPNRTIEDVIKAIDAGYPVMVLQVYWTDQLTGHNRVIVGYDLKRNEFIANDPSDFGPYFRIPFATFQELWRLWKIVEPGWPANFLWLILKVSDPDPI